ncbi:LysR family transcriptional regulator [Runella slithyformis]|uniref:Transcriptional regulator, LysR family n=1 Tax=Runella slithyformis (strain ATCC 29530 / DSM 19594 / LMG 11500 / NCIMB 11436 / LSU 4) TaxID=761193 RepID=A0A7U3ZM58_RUNSL|nr:LysR family transcriptional regulator [Runella slithyformis]AEI49755.1 transcriptional regulator, LysR family [Runella slithyformis DSM 19594]
MNFTLHQLNIFQTVVRLKSITKAAEVLHMTQPAVSIQLKNLQDQFDIPLTEVIGRQLYITDFGLELATITEKILVDVDTIQHKMRAYKGILSGTLRMAGVSTGKYIMPYFLSDFMEEYQAIDLILDVTNRGKVIESLAKNEIDFAVVSVLPAQLEVEEEKLMPNKLLFIGLPGRPWQPENDEGFASIPLIHREEGSGTRMIIDAYFQELKVAPKVRLTLTSSETVKQAVIAGLGVAALSVFSLKNELERGEVEILPLKGFPLMSEWRLIWLKNKRLSPVCKAYLDFIRTRKKIIFDRHFSWANQY